MSQATAQSHPVSSSINFFLVRLINMLFKVLVFCALATLCSGGYITHHGEDYSSLHSSGGHGGGGISSQNVVLHHVPGEYGGHHDDHEDHYDLHAYPKYQYKYSVNDPHTEDQKSHWENRDGGAVEGQYSLVQPDGSTRTVTYSADDHKGFEAIVETSGGEHSHHYLH